MDNQAQDKQDSKPQPAVVKPKRNRRFQKEILHEDSEKLILKVKHTPYKGEKLSDTVRTDNKFNPRQRTFAGRDL